MSGTALEPSKSIGAFPDVPDLATSGEEAYVYFHIDPKHTNFINRIIEGYEYLGVMTSVALEVLSSLSDYVTIEG